MAKRGSVWALAALQGAVTLSWMAYAYHQPRLLAHFGFEGLAGLLGWYLVFAGTTWLAFSPKHFAMVNVGLILVWLGVAVLLGRMFKERSGGEA